jgi:hypothetical protein
MRLLALVRVFKACGAEPIRFEKFVSTSDFV